MSKVLGFMKQVAYGLQMEGNFGTAHVYRSSIFVPFVPFTIVPSIFVGHHTFRICSVRCIRELVPTINGLWVMKI